MKAFLTLFIFLVSITSYSQVGAIWSTPTSGTIDGVPFTITDVVGSVGISTYDFSTPDFSAGPLSANQQCLTYEGYNTVTISLDSPIELYIYPKYWRTDTYLFSDSVTLLSGSNLTLTDNYTADAVSYADGIFKVSSPVSTFTITSTIQGCCSSQVLTFAGINCTPTSSIDTQSACDSYTWIDGNTYTASTNNPNPTLHTINSGSYYYLPSTLTINTGDVVEWINNGGFHDVNGETNTITGLPYNNPEVFNSPSTSVVGAVIYSHAFTVPGTYEYDCSVGQHAANGMIGTITVLPPPPTFTTINAEGCDSIITLDLTISQSTSSIIETACDFYIAPDGQIYNSTGSYSSTVTNAAGCDSIITIDLTINPLPSNDVTQNGGTITATQTSATYQWIDCDNGNAPIVGEVNQTYFPSTTGNYAVIVTVNGCSSTSECFLVDFTRIGELNNTPKQLIKIVDVLGRETPFKPNTPLIYIYNDGTVERKVVLK